MAKKKKKFTEDDNERNSGVTYALVKSKSETILDAIKAVKCPPITDAELDIFLETPSWATAGVLQPIMKMASRIIKDRT